MFIVRSIVSETLYPNQLILCQECIAAALLFTMKGTNTTEDHFFTLQT